MRASGQRSIVEVLKRLVHAMSPAAIDAETIAIDQMTESLAACRRDLSGIRENLGRLSAQAAETQRQTEDLVDICRRDAHQRAALAALPSAKLLSDALVLEGSPAQRARVERLTVGQPIDRPFSKWIGVTRCASAAPDVRALWDRLLQREVSCGDVLHGFPSTVLDVPNAIVSTTSPGALRMSLRQPLHPTALHHAVCGVPRFTYDFPPRKLRNFGHWLLDCVPQVVAISTVAPDAVFLLPTPLRGFHESTLSLAGLTQRQMLAWDGAPIECDRLLVLESDGRTGGGRPLSALTEMRRVLTSSAGAPAARGRRIYVSRRDARAKRHWLLNEPDVETVFRRRGFEILVMADCPMEEQVQIFREAGVVAGISGAGLADIVFSSPGTHVIVLLSDSLIRWYADEIGQRSAWTKPDNGTAGRLAALGDSPRFYAHVAAAFEQYCHSFIGGDVMPLDDLTDFLDEVLKQADRA
jgi:hypothetical protein